VDQKLRQKNSDSCIWKCVLEHENKHVLQCRNPAQTDAYMTATKYDNATLQYPFEKEAYDAEALCLERLMMQDQ
jgi:hypothetical protein